MSLVVWSILNILWESFLLLLHVVLACRNLTTNEVANRLKYSYFKKPLQMRHPEDSDRSFMEIQASHNDSSIHQHHSVRYQNPFDRGLLRNIYHFITGKPLYRPDEWYSMYDIDSLMTV
jgi:hypothetical protein